MATVSLKLLVDNSTEKVIFAEAGKDFVDFLFGLLEIPLGSLLSLLVKEGMCESLTLSKVYESVNKFGNECLQPDQTKKSLLNPDMPFSNTKVTPLMQQLGYRKSQSSSSSNYYGSSRSDDRKEVDGYVKGSVTCMISDRPNGEAHVQHFYHKSYQQFRCQRHWYSERKDGGHRHEGFGVGEDLLPIQYCSHRCICRKDSDEM